MTGILMMSVGNSYGSLPINTVAPAVSGTATVGSTLSTTNGTWTGAPAPTFTYQWQRDVSNISGATSSTYVIQSADVGSTLRCVVTATNPSGAVSANSNSTATVPPVTGQQQFICSGTFTWVAPAGVTSVSAVAVGGGASGGGSLGGGAGGTGGALAYKNNITVAPGSSYSVVVGAGRAGAVCGTNPGGNSSFTAGFGTVTAGGGSFSPGAPSGTFDGGGNGGQRGNISGGGGGGGGGYSGNGGSGGNCGVPCGSAGAGGAGGGGRYASFGAGRGGGGVGIFGQGSNGTANGGGGSGGSSSTNINGGAHGAGGGGDICSSGGNGAGGAVRIIWPGTTRTFPSTCTGNL